MTIQHLVSLTTAWVSISLAVSSAAQTFTPESLQVIFDQFRSDDVKLRNEAGARGRALASQWSRSDVSTMRAFMPVLLAGLQDSDKGVRVSASAFFGLIGMSRPDDALAILDGFEEDILDEITEGDDQISANLIRCFAAANPKPPEIALPSLIEATERPPSEPGKIAVYGLMRAAASSPAARDAVVALFGRKNDPDEASVLAQAAARAKPADSTVVGHIATLLRHDSKPVVQDAIRALEAIGEPAVSAIAQLQDLAGSATSDKDVRQAAQTAIASIRRDAAPR